MLIAALAISSCGAPARTETSSAATPLKYKWSCVPMDSTWDEIKNPAATLAIGKYAPMMAPLQEIIAYTDEEYEKGYPESGLSNFAADIIREAAEEWTGESVDLALTNFGGIRTSLPKGAVRVYDILSIFPFENRIVVFDIKGDDLYAFFKRMASRRVEALSNIRLKVDAQGQITFFHIGSQPIDPDRIYRFATIDFLFDGGDSIDLKQAASNVRYSNILIRDAVETRIRRMGLNNEIISLHEDGRVKIEGRKR